jgi:hypothetical protein
MAWRPTTGYEVDIEKSSRSKFANDYKKKVRQSSFRESLLNIQFSLPDTYELATPQHNLGHKN